MKNLFSMLSCAAMAAGGLSIAAPAAAQSTLETVKARGHLNCQVGPPRAGFYQLLESGDWEGSDVAVCRAMAAAIFGDPNKVEFQSVSASVRFTSLANGESDVLSRTATWTVGRDAALGIDFTAPVFHDGQGFLVRKDSGIKSAYDLTGATVCVITGHTSEATLQDFSRANNLDIQAVAFDDSAIVNETYLNGGCDAITTDKGVLASEARGFPDPSEHVVLPEILSKEPLTPAVRNGDNQWGDIVQWTVFALINAEELGITQANVEEIAANPPNPLVARFLGAEGELNTGLGLPKDWVVHAIKAVGNYGEIYEHYLGDGRPEALGIPRAGSANALWTEGGLMFSPPFR
ncbi:general L-amino acid-binding periplasmic protein AapJ [Phaeobacter inhibens]|uniref:General L-amino acid-binding periplasmic protein AapJ n=1 Tax=Phaeobacter inhibens TaxID=221822 RepID=A0ABM6RB91_9RHOB|nr:amino acid ABC transporter substrate-binding protein [Phaeobacter inhibens]AUQ49099.1 general L-amino acid-binding periplasmic protein AapJ [Phaeobacter inhibens]AUQ55133.1 general L-amino acid-binding periplasmic protein AapJ [Phaeobacter inhibens]AUQ79149.1 general L-amino acid-binding periplasmic protein AapJ [Phaeobacter inhibens]AUQ93599.1 general L-amino acid-binding periplasmic protein AapJ [Phaeobacter inhibens]AUR16308.1 general L-amino acid-binding periplasmic protein AapJ [Phaeob